MKSVFRINAVRKTEKAPEKTSIRIFFTVLVVMGVAYGQLRMK